MGFLVTIKDLMLFSSLSYRIPKGCRNPESLLLAMENLEILQRPKCLLLAKVTFRFYLGYRRPEGLLLFINDLKAFSWLKETRMSS